jgi:hypothetical protein
MIGVYTKRGNLDGQTYTYVHAHTQRILDDNEGRGQGNAPISKETPK